MKNKITQKERLKVWSSYSEEVKKGLQKAIQVFAPGTIYKIERW